MKIVKLSTKEFQNLANKLKGNLRVCLNEIDIHWTDTPEERKGKLRKAFDNVY